MLELRICIDVDDLERGIAFYSNALDLRVARRFDRHWVELVGASSPIDLLAVVGEKIPFREAHCNAASSAIGRPYTSISWCAISMQPSHAR